MASDDLAEIVGKIAAIQAKESAERIERDQLRQIEREQNRKDFPQMQQNLTILARFSPRAVWAEEGGKTIGRVPS